MIIAFILMLIIFIEKNIIITSFTYQQQCQQRIVRSTLSMDDEIARSGIKIELTTRHKYLETRFSRLSMSGHDITSFNDEDTKEWINDYQEIYDSNYGINENDIYLGNNRKGIYVCYIGGLPLFSTGNRLHSECNKQTLTFDAPCDEDHIVIKNSKVSCIRSNLEVGSYDNGKYTIESSKVRFLGISQVWPTSSQPENFWGTEGQFCQWNNNFLTEKGPLSW